MSPLSLWPDPARPTRLLTGYYAEILNDTCENINTIGKPALKLSNRDLKTTFGLKHILKSFLKRRFFVFSSSRKFIFILFTNVYLKCLGYKRILMV